MLLLISCIIIFEINCPRSKRKPNKKSDLSIQVISPSHAKIVYENAEKIHDIISNSPAQLEVHKDTIYTKNDRSFEEEKMLDLMGIEIHQLYMIKKNHIWDNEINYGMKTQNAKHQYHRKLIRLQNQFNPKTEEQEEIFAKKEEEITTEYEREISEISKLRELSDQDFDKTFNEQVKNLSMKFFEMKENIEIKSKDLDFIPSKKTWNDYLEDIMNELHNKDFHLPAEMALSFLIEHLKEYASRYHLHESDANYQGLDKFYHFAIDQIGICIKNKNLNCNDLGVFNCARERYSAKYSKTCHRLRSAFKYLTLDTMKSIWEEVN